MAFLICERNRDAEQRAEQIDGQGEAEHLGEEGDEESYQHSSAPLLESRAQGKVLRDEEERQGYKAEDYGPHPISVGVLGYHLWSHLMVVAVLAIFIMPT